MSFIEAVTNTAVGYLLAVAVQLVAFPLFGLEVGLSENLAIAVLFTAVSIARSFTLRRLFERLRRPVPILYRTPQRSSGSNAAPAGGRLVGMRSIPGPSSSSIGSIG
jgi:hypothetical protein